MKTKIWLLLALVVLICVVGWSVQGQKRNRAITRWEYKVVDTPMRNIGSTGEWEAGLNQFGSQGWELVSEHQYENSTTIRYTFKRMR